MLNRRNTHDFLRPMPESPQSVKSLTLKEEIEEVKKLLSPN